MVTQELDLPLAPAALLARCAGEPYVFALDGGGDLSWGSGQALLGFRPRATLRVEASGDAVVRTDGRQQRWRGDPLALLDRFCGAWAVAPPTPTPGAGVVAALSYDLRHWIERLQGPARVDRDLPVLYAAYHDWLLSYSFAERRYRLVSAAASRSELQHIGSWIERLAHRPAAASLTGRARIVPDLSREQYLAAVQAVLDYIAAGDVYQVNLAQRFVVSDSPAPAALFAALQREHEVPFAAYIDAGDFVLISNSPECFLTLRDHTVTTFPVKGTRRRGVDARSDQALALELSTDPKERAEHVMIVDLERNDLGRVCCTGSVRVEELARVQTFPSLHHLVSRVSGRLRPSQALGAVLRATFPGGSITGAPKIRAMEIIDTLEPVSRSFYTGAIGFIAPSGDAVFSIAIRTAIVAGRTMTYYAGGGIVADSVPAREYEETLLKAQAFFTALTAVAA